MRWGFMALHYPPLPPASGGESYVSRYCIYLNYSSMTAVATDNRRNSSPNPTADVHRKYTPPNPHSRQPIKSTRADRAVMHITSTQRPYNTRLRIYIPLPSPRWHMCRAQRAGTPSGRTDMRDVYIKTIYTYKLRMLPIIRTC